MAKTKFETVWKILSKYRFDVESHFISDLTCVLCQDIVKDCRQTLCGCRYCLECISNYLDGGEKTCPGSTIDCEENIISMTMGIQIDHVANMKVSRLVVQCPHPDCHHREELRNLEDHVNSHSIDCPYSEIGCDKIKLNKSSIEEHLKREGLIHCNLLIGSLQQMRNEWILAKHKSENETQMINSLQNEINQLKLQNDDQNQLIENLELNISKIKNEIKTWKMEDKKHQKTLATIKQLIETKTEEMDKKLNQANQLVENSLRVQKPPKYSKNTRSPSPTFEAFETMIKYSFKWEINNFSSEQLDARNNTNKNLLSDPFYSHPDGYKMCFVIWPDGIKSSNNKILIVGFQLMVGENDKNLEWPMRKTIDISLMEHGSNQFFKSFKYHYDTVSNEEKTCFNRPLINSNKALKIKNFISLDELKSSPNLYCNDKIILTCVVE